MLKIVASQKKKKKLADSCLVLQCSLCKTANTRHVTDSNVAFYGEKNPIGNLFVIPLLYSLVK